MIPWRALNRAAYAGYFAASHLRPWWLGRRAAVPVAARRRGRPAMLYWSWGRLGDTVLASGMTRQLQSVFGRPVVYVGRPEVRALVEDHVERFVAFDDGAWRRSAGYRAAFARELADDYDLVVGDVHLFHGGTFHVRGLFDALPARWKFVYEGYAGRQGLAPFRPWPETARCVPSLRREAGTVLEHRHVSADLLHYLRVVAAAVGTDTEPVADPPRVELGRERPDGLLAEHGVAAGGYVACQPFSHNSKKDLSVERWRRLLAAFPQRTFVLLGAAGQRSRAAELAAPHVVDLCGRTDLSHAVAVVRHAGAFVGVDSGLTHVAAAVGQRTVCVAQSANLGTFFPYPAAWDLPGLEVVDHPAYRGCSGCFMACRHEPITMTFRRGARCLRTLPDELVRSALERALPVVETPGGRVCPQASGAP